MPKGLGIGLYPPESGLQSDLANLTLMFDEAMKTNIPSYQQPSEYFEGGNDYRDFRRCMQRLRLANLWRGRGTCSEILNHSNTIFCSVVKLLEYEPHLEIACDDCGALAYVSTIEAEVPSDNFIAKCIVKSKNTEWTMITKQQLAAIYMLHAFFYLQPECFKLQIRVTLKQMTDIFILLEACGARQLYTAQICLTKLLIHGAIRIVADQQLYNPLAVKDFNEFCAYDLEIDARYGKLSKEQNVKLITATKNAMLTHVDICAKKEACNDKPMSSADKGLSLTEARKIYSKLYLEIDRPSTSNVSIIDEDMTPQMFLLQEAMHCVQHESTTTDKGTGIVTPSVARSHVLSDQDLQSDPNTMLKISRVRKHNMEIASKRAKLRGMKLVGKEDTVNDKLSQVQFDKIIAEMGLNKRRPSKYAILHTPASIYRMEKRRFRHTFSDLRNRISYLLNRDNFLKLEADKYDFSYTDRRLLEAMSTMSKSVHDASTDNIEQQLSQFYGERRSQASARKATRTSTSSLAATNMQTETTPMEHQLAILEEILREANQTQVQGMYDDIETGDDDATTIKCRAPTQLTTQINTNDSTTSSDNRQLYKDIFYELDQDTAMHCRAPTPREIDKKQSRIDNKKEKNNKPQTSSAFDTGLTSPTNEMLRQVQALENILMSIDDDQYEPAQHSEQRCSSRLSTPALDVNNRVDNLRQRTTSNASASSRNTKASPGKPPAPKKSRFEEDKPQHQENTDGFLAPAVPQSKRRDSTISNASYKVTRSRVASPKTVNKPSKLPNVNTMQDQIDFLDDIIALHNKSPLPYEPEARSKVKMVRSSTKRSQEPTTMTKIVIKKKESRVKKKSPTKETRSADSMLAQVEALDNILKKAKTSVSPVGVKKENKKLSLQKKQVSPQSLPEKRLTRSSTGAMAAQVEALDDILKLASALD